MQESETPTQLHDHGTESCFEGPFHRSSGRETTM